MLNASYLTAEQKWPDWVFIDLNTGNYEVIHSDVQESQPSTHNVTQALPILYTHVPSSSQQPPAQMHGLTHELQGQAPLLQQPTVQIHGFNEGLQNQAPSWQHPPAQMYGITHELQSQARSF